MAVLFVPLQGYKQLPMIAYALLAKLLQTV